VTLTLNGFQPRNRNRFTIPMILFTCAAAQKYDTNYKICASTGKEWATPISRPYNSDGKAHYFQKGL
jgi:hypothetical protein